MKKLTLIRHAKSGWRCGIRDFDRPLDHRGERDAPRMAAHLRQQGFSPDLILSSLATRAATTAEEIARGIGYDVDTIAWKDQVYDATVVDLLQLIRKCDAQYTPLTIIGHNPALSELANRLQPMPIDNMPTCSVVTIHFEAGAWHDIEHTLGNLAQFDTPKSIK